MAGIRTRSRVDRTVRRALWAFVPAVALASWTWGQMPGPGGPPVVPGQPPATQPAPATAEDTVVDVLVEGNRNVPLEKIAPHVKTRAGRPYRLDVVQDDVRRLTQTKMFVNVHTKQRRVPEGIVVVFEVLERPVLHYVKFIGNSGIKLKKIQETAEVKSGDPFDTYAVAEAKRKLETLYREKGYSKARVTVIEGNQPTDRGAIFLIDEGQKQRVLWTSFVGNTIATDGRLRTQIESKPGFFWFLKGEVDRKKIDEDVNKLVAYYRGLGFFRARIGRELHYNEKENWLRLTFVIDEGPRHKIRNVTVIGNTKLPTEELSTDLKLKGGEYFDQGKLQNDLTSLQDKYGCIGYVFADVKADPRILEEPGTVDLVYSITEGDRYRVGRINVEVLGDYPRTKLTTVLNRISLHPGEIVDIRKLRDSERRLQFSGLFLNDPQKGVKPKIVFQPPEKETEVARQPGERGAHRGQSPELGQEGWEPGDRPLNFLIVPPPEAAVPEAAPQQQTAATEQTASSTPPQPVLPATTAAQGSPLEQMATDLAARLESATPASVAPSTQKYVARYQYSPDGGYSTPMDQPRPTPVTTPSTVPAAAPVMAQPGGVPPATAMPNGFPPQGAAPNGMVAEAPGAIPPNEPRELNEGWLLPRRDTTRPLDLTPTVQPTETGRFMFGVGVNSEAGLVGNIMVEERDFDITNLPRSCEDFRTGRAFRGGGQLLRIEAVPGTQVQRYAINFREPYLLDTNVSLGLSGFYYDRIYTEYWDQRVGGRMNFGYQLTPDVSATFGFRGERVTIYNPVTMSVPSLAQVVGHPNALYGFQAGLTNDTRDNAFLPTQGHMWDVSFEQVTGTYNYPGVDVDLRKYFTLHQRADGSGRHVLSLNSHFGWKDVDCPIYERYYAGNFSTIRGFMFRGVTPRDPATGVGVGGDAELLASAEYMFPITADDALRGVVFCDSGTVQTSLNQWNQAYRVAPGFGLRITIPAMGPAPIALDFAFPIVTQPGDRVQNFAFFIGVAR